MKVKKIIEKTEEAEIEFSGAILLSKDEAEFLLSKEEREYKAYWWLRTPGGSNKTMCDVNIYGYISYNSGYVYITDSSIRPALIVSNLGNFHVGDTFYLDKWEFKIISPTLAWLHKQDIGESMFGDTDDYMTSRVKKIVDEWYTKLMKKCKSFERMEKLVKDLFDCQIEMCETLPYTFKDIFGFNEIDLEGLEELEEIGYYD